MLVKDYPRLLEYYILLGLNRIYSLGWSMIGTYLYVVLTTNLDKI